MSIESGRNHGHPPYIFSALSFLSAGAVIAFSVTVLTHSSEPTSKTRIQITAAVSIVTATLTILYHIIIMGVYIAHRVSKGGHEPVLAQTPTPEAKSPEAGLYDFQSDTGFSRSARRQIFYPSPIILSFLTLLLVLWIVVLGLTASATSLGNDTLPAASCVAGLGVVLIGILLGYGAWKMFRKNRKSTGVTTGVIPDRRDSEDDIQWGG